MSERMQFRSVGLMGGVADVDSRSHRVLVRFPHEVTDSFKTRFGVDAFRESFAKRLPIMCAFHNIKDPIGRVVHAQVTPTANELTARFSDLEAVPSAKRVFSQVESGDLTDYSFGYTDGPEFPHPDPQLRRQGIRSIPKATMREISPVSIGSIPGAGVVEVRDFFGSYGNAEVRLALAKLDRIGRHREFRLWLDREDPDSLEDRAMELAADRTVARARLDRIAIMSEARR